VKKSLLVFILLSGLASAFNYFAYPALSRLLPADQYINITVALSLFTQISTLLSSLVAITIGLTKERHATPSNHTIEILQSVLFRLLVVVSIVLLALSPIIAGSVHMPVTYIIPICIMLLISIPIAITSGFLNGKGLMVKLGLVTVVSAGLQFTVAISASIATNSGLLTLLSMALSQCIAIAVIYIILRHDNLPKLHHALTLSVSKPDKKRLGKILGYTVLSSIGIMVINLAQVVDLLIAQRLTSHDVKFYTDIYVISRVVFFAGMIFIWPFLSAIDIHARQKNIAPIFKLMGIFVAFGVLSSLALILFGQQIISLLFNVQYAATTIDAIGLLSILYKVTFLIITAITLYFIVLRSNKALILGALSGIALVTYYALAPATIPLLSMLIGINGIGIIIAVAGIGFLVADSHKRTNPA